MHGRRWVITQFLVGIQSSTATTGVLWVAQRRNHSVPHINTQHRIVISNNSMDKCSRKTPLCDYRTRNCKIHKIRCKTSLWEGKLHLMEENNLSYVGVEPEFPCWLCWEGSSCAWAGFFSSWARTGFLGSTGWGWSSFLPATAAHLSLPCMHSPHAGFGITPAHLSSGVFFLRTLQFSLL